MRYAGEAIGVDGATWLGFTLEGVLEVLGVLGVAGVLAAGVLAAGLLLLLLDPHAAAPIEATATAATTAAPR